ARARDRRAERGRAPHVATRPGAQAAAAQEPAALMGLLRAPSRETCVALAALAVTFASASVRAGDWDLSLDVRALDSDGRRSFLDRGQGKLRFDEEDSGVRLGRLR